eukprot:1345731-Pyramimonas_sp.AAC.1
MLSPVAGPRPDRTNCNSSGGQCRAVSRRCPAGVPKSCSVAGPRPDQMFLLRRPVLRGVPWCQVVSR